MPLPPRNKLLSETIHSDYLIAKCLDSGCFPRGVGFYVYIFVLVYLLFFFWLKKRKETNITVLKYCLTYSVSLGSVCAQDGAELTSASFCLEWGAGWRGVGGARQCLSSMCLPASVPLPLPSTPHPSSAFLGR